MRSSIGFSLPRGSGGNCDSDSWSADRLLRIRRRRRTSTERTCPWLARTVSQGSQLAGIPENQGYGRIPPKCTKFDMGNGAKGIPHVRAPSVSSLLRLSKYPKNWWDRCLLLPQFVFTSACWHVD